MKAAITNLFNPKRVAQSQAQREAAQRQAQEEAALRQAQEEAAQRQAPRKAMLAWINRVQAAMTPTELHDLVFDPTSERITFLREVRPPIVNDILTCSLAIRVWELHEDYLRCLITCAKLRSGADTKAEAALATLANTWLKIGFEDTGPLSHLGFALLDYRKCMHLWTWTCADQTVTNYSAHGVLNDVNMKRQYDLTKNIKPSLPNTQVDACKRQIKAVQVTSSYVLSYYKAVYQDLLTEGKDLPDVVWLQKSLREQQAKGQILHDTKRGRPGSSSSQRSSPSRSLSPSKRDPTHVKPSLSRAS